MLGDPYPVSRTLEVKEIGGPKRTEMGMSMGGGAGADENVVDADETLQQIESQKEWCEVM